MPFPVESALSGVMKPVSENERLWYRRTFELPAAMARAAGVAALRRGGLRGDGGRERQEVGRHRGGYDGFTFDITEALNKTGANELVVAVWDPTDAGTQPRGKQVRKPGGIFYTPTSGIWQTVWLEPVRRPTSKTLKITPDVDEGSVTVRPITPAILGGASVEVSVRDGGRDRSQRQSPPGAK